MSLSEYVITSGIPIRKCKCPETRLFIYGVATAPSSHILTILSLSLFKTLFQTSLHLSQSQHSFTRCNHSNLFSSQVS